MGVNKKYGGYIHHHARSQGEASLLRIINDSPSTHHAHQPLMLLSSLGQIHKSELRDKNKTLVALPHLALELCTSS